MPATALRSKDRSIRGLHDAIVPEDLFDRVQQIRAYKARVKQPSPPSDEYLLRKMLRCERCGARMHGTRGSRPPVRRYLCSTRRHGEGCAQPITKAEPLENQLADWLRGFQPDAELRQLLLDTIAEHAHTQDDQTARRAELAEQLQRLRDVYVLGDLAKAQYTMRRQALQDELERLAPPTDPQLVEADRLLSNFERFWETEISPAERYRLIASLFEQIGKTTARSSPSDHTPSFVPYFQTLAKTPKNGSGNCGVNSGSDGGRLRTLRPISAKGSKCGGCRLGSLVLSRWNDHLQRSDRSIAATLTSTSAGGCSQGPDQRLLASTAPSSSDPALRRMLCEMLVSARNATTPALGVVRRFRLAGASQVTDGSSRAGTL